MFWLYLYAILDGYNKKPKTRAQYIKESIYEIIALCLILGFIGCSFYGMYIMFTSLFR